MEKRFKKLVSAFVLATLMLVSLVSVCKQMLMTCGFACSQQAISVMHMNDRMDACAQNSSACSTSMKDHMAMFASMYPSVPTDAVSLLLVVSAAFFIVWSLIAKSALRDHEKLRAKLKSLRLRLSKSIAPDFLVFAFSQGILNSKIYA